MTSRLALACFGVATFALVGCGGNATCDKNATVDLTSKVGTCTVAGGSLLGDKMSCTAKVSSCSESEQQTLTRVLQCLDGLPVCAVDSQLAWEVQQQGCYSQLTSLGEGCKTAFFGTTLPGEDAGIDAGPPPDAGRQPVTDGGSALAFVAVADERTIAFAWVPLQPATEVAKWELNAFDTANAEADGGERLPDQYYEPGNLRVAEIDAGAGVERRFYLAGVTSTNAQVYASDAGTMVEVDAGTDGGVMCMDQLDCPPERVCDLGQCKTQACTPMNDTCPPGYQCILNGCLRMVSDGGVVVGPKDAGSVLGLPFLSSEVRVKTGPPGFTQTTIGGFEARRPDMVAMDSARQFVAIEQGAQPVGHFSVRRGADFVSDDNASVIDTVGRSVKLAWNADNKVLFACYTVGTGVRVRRSFDYGRTWGAGALTLLPPVDDDGGTSATISDCDIAPWKNGGALLATVDGENVVVRTISDSLAEQSNEVAFASAPTDGGATALFAPQRTVIATLPSESLVHVGFTASRNLNGIVDQDVAAVYRDGTTGGFTQPQFVNAAGTAQGNGFNQDYMTLAIDPTTKRAIAAYTASESTGMGSYNTVYVSIFLPASRQWTTGSDLTVFVTDSSNTTSELFPAKRQSDLWDAFSPSLAVMRDGRIWLSVMAAKRDTSTEFHQYLVGFDFEKQSPKSMAKGWFLPPAVMMSQTVAVDPRGSGASASASNSCIATDGQISVYGTMVEGVGTLHEIENRAIFISRP